MKSGTGSIRLASHLAHVTRFEPVPEGPPHRCYLAAPGGTRRMAIGAKRALCNLHKFPQLFLCKSTKIQIFEKKCLTIGLIRL